MHQHVYIYNYLHVFTVKAVSHSSSCNGKVARVPSVMAKVEWARDGNLLLQ